MNTRATFFSKKKQKTKAEQNIEHVDCGPPTAEVRRKCGENLK